jgi:hypothetical protein
MALWWEHNKSYGPKGPTCKICVTHPELVKTGYGEPKSLKCPVCKRKYMSNGQLYDKEKYKKLMQEKLKEKQQEIWESIWGNTKAP